MQAVRTSKPWPRVSVSSTAFQRFCTRGVLRTAPKRSVGVRAPLFPGPIRPRRELQYKRYRWRLYFCRRLLRWFLRSTPRLQKAAYPVETGTPPCFSDCPGTRLSPQIRHVPGRLCISAVLRIFCVGETQLSAGYAATVLPAAHGGGTSRDCAGTWFVPPGPVSRCGLLRLLRRRLFTRRRIQSCRRWG